MASDFFIAMFWLPMLVITFVLIIAYIRIDKPGATPQSFHMLGGRRIVLGVSGSMLATFFYASGSMLLLGLHKAELGHIPDEDLIGWIVAHCFSNFILLGPAVLIGLLVMGVPFVFLMTKIHMISHFGGAVLLTVIVASAYTLYRFLSPYNLWCETNPIDCGVANFSDTFIFWVIVFMGFSLGARLPLWRNKVV